MARSSFFRFGNEGTGIRDDLPPGHAPSVTVFAPLPEEWFKIDFNDSGRWGWSKRQRFSSQDHRSFEIIFIRVDWSVNNIIWYPLNVLAKNGSHFFFN